MQKKPEYLWGVLRSEAALAAFGAVGFALVFCYPLLCHLALPGVANDWDMFLELQWVPYYTVTHFRQLPLWNPYECGGIAMLANPQSSFLTPFWLLDLLFGPVVGLHLGIVIHLAIAWAGGYFLARVVGINWMGAVCCAAVFSGSSWFYLHTAAGHTAFTSLAYMPWIVALAWIGARRQRLGYAVIAGALMALTFGEGGVHEVFFEAMLLALVMAPLALQRRSLWPIRVGLVTFLFAAGFAAMKLLPVMEFYGQHPRPITGAYWNTASLLLIGLFSRSQELYRHDVNLWGFHEYGAYVGLFILPALVAILRPRRALPWLFAAAMLFLLARGDAGSWAPWTLIHRLPILHSERLPSRLLIPMVLALGVMAGIGIDMMRRVRPPWGGVAAVLLVGIATIDCFLVGPPNLRHVLERPLPPQHRAERFRQHRAPFYYLDMLKTALRNEGALSCYEYTEFKTDAVGHNETGYKGEEYVVGDGSVRLTRWSPNALSYEAAVPRPTLMVINQNYDRNWRLVEGEGELTSRHGLLAVRIPAGDECLRLAYRPIWFFIGALISALTILLGVAVWLRPWRLWRIPSWPRG